MVWNKNSVYGRYPRKSIKYQKKTIRNIFYARKTWKIRRNHSKIRYFTNCICKRYVVNIIILRITYIGQYVFLHRFKMFPLINRLLIMPLGTIVPPIPYYYDVLYSPPGTYYVRRPPRFLYLSLRQSIIPVRFMRSISKCLLRNNSGSLKRFAEKSRANQKQKKKQN